MSRHAYEQVDSATRDIERAELVAGLENLRDEAHQIACEIGAIASQVFHDKTAEEIGATASGIKREHAKLVAVHDAIRLNEKLLRDLG